MVLLKVSHYSFTEIRTQIFMMIIYQRRTLKRAIKWTINAQTYLFPACSLVILAAGLLSRTVNAVFASRLVMTLSQQLVYFKLYLSENIEFSVIFAREAFSVNFQCALFSVSWLSRACIFYTFGLFSVARKNLQISVIVSGRGTRTTIRSIITFTMFISKIYFLSSWNEGNCLQFGILIIICGWIFQEYLSVRGYLWQLLPPFRYRSVTSERKNILSYPWRLYQLFMHSKDFEWL